MQNNRLHRFSGKRRRAKKQQMSLDTAEFRRALGHFASGVTVVTVLRPDGGAIGVTVSAFASLSLIPPLILFCLDRSTVELEAYTDAETFAVSVLSANQGAVSDAFAFPGKVPPFDVHPATPGRLGPPLIDGALAHIECRRHAVSDGGDHVIMIGQVEQARTYPEKKPLVYYHKTYGRFDGGST